MTPSPSDVASSRAHTSIVIPCYNNARFVAATIESALAQTLPAADIIVVDDGSTDSSLDVIRSFSGIRIISQPNGGLPAARNSGLAHVTTEYVLFLDADDRLEPDAIALHLAAMEKNPQAPMVYGSTYVIDVEGHRIGENVLKPGRFDWRGVLFGKTPSCSQAMFRRAPLAAIGDFDCRIRIGEDFPVYLKLTKSAEIVCHGALVAEYRKHPGQLTKRPAALLEAMINAQRAFQATFEPPLRNDPIWSDAERHWRTYWGQWIPGEAVRCARRGDWRRVGACVSTYMRHMPETVAGTARYGLRRFIKSH